jgi:hypothetical protein
MSKVKHQGKILGWCGVLCLAIFWSVLFAPEVGLFFQASTLRKFIAMGIFFAAVLFPVIAGIRGSRWWFAAAAMSLATWIDFCLLRVVR